MKYIDTDKLSEKIESIGLYVQKSADYNDGRNNMKMMVLDITDSLQQEQPEVDLEKEVERYFQGLWPGIKTAEQCNTDLHFTPLAIMRMTTHFYELGLKARKGD